MLIGPSGCGKTTLISIIAGLLRADGGQVRVLGSDHRHLGRMKKILGNAGIDRRWLVQSPADTIVERGFGYRNDLFIESSKILGEKAARAALDNAGVAAADIATVAARQVIAEGLSPSADAALARYQGGVGSLLDLITAQQDDTNAKVQRIQSYLDWYQSLARLNFALGASESRAAAAKPQ